MNAEEVLRRIRREKKQWEDADRGTREAEWVLRGINVCIGHVQEVIAEQKNKAELRKPTISRWFAKDLYHAIFTALNLLGRGERTKAVRVLEAARNAARSQDSHH